MFAADGAVPESSQSGTPQGEGKSKLIAPYKTVDNIVESVIVEFFFFKYSSLHTRRDA